MAGRDLSTRDMHKVRPVTYSLWVKVDYRHALGIVHGGNFSFIIL